MIQIKPVVQHQSRCPHCNTPLHDYDVLWQGIHVCAVSRCPGCQAEITEDLKVGHSRHTPYQADAATDQLFGSDSSRAWYGVPLLRSLESPTYDYPLELKVEKFHDAREVIILNCIDSLYGHSLLKLLNAAAHLQNDRDLGLVVMVQEFLRWMVPERVAEVWTVNIPLSGASRYYPELDRRIKQECERFGRIYLSPALSHPRDFDITLFTGIARHDFSKDRFRITFIWREDRPWWNPPAGYTLPLRILDWLGLMGPVLQWQNWKIQSLFSLLRPDFPGARYTVAGLGTRTGFPAWTDDQRVERYTGQAEREMCQVYADSRLVIGVHGSNMLLPSAHAGMTLDLMPDGRWGNFAQGVLYQQGERFANDQRITSWRYRYLPMNQSVRVLNIIASSMLAGFANAVAKFEAS